MRNRLIQIFFAGSLLWGGAAQAQFLDFSQPARAMALGGNLAAMPEGASAMAFNPAGLSLQECDQVSARYEGLFSGFGSDDLSTGNLTFLLPVASFGAFGASWDHLGSVELQQDRMRIAWGKAFPAGGFLDSAAVGFSLSYLTQRYSLSTPLSGVSLAGLSSGAFGFGGGVLLSLPLHLTLGISADDVNSPNLGLVGTDLVPMILRWGLAAPLLDRDSIRLQATAAQSYSDNRLETQGGVECSLPRYGVHFRLGADSEQGSVGFGYGNQDLFLDYAYSFSIFGASQVGGVGLPGSHLLEMGFRWGGVSGAYGEALRLAREAESAGRWEKALRAYQECLALEPSDAAALQGRRNALLQWNRLRAGDFYQAGLSAEQRGDLSGARDQFEMAMNLAPDNGLYPAALKRVEGPRPAAGAAQAGGDDMEVAAAIGRASQLISKGDSKAAAKVLSEALRKHPHQAALEMILGGLAAPPPKEGTGPAAQAAQSAQLLSAESDLYLSKGRPDLAKKNLEEALKAQPKNLQIQQKLIRLEVSTQAVSPQKAKLAQDLYEKGLRKYLEGDLDGAIAAWEAALEADPNQTKAQNNLVRAKLEKEAKP